MADWGLNLLQNDFGTTASIFVVVLVSSAMIVAAFNRNPVKIDDVTLLVFGSAGTISGFKILVLTLALKSNQLGPLGDDKPTLLLGGIAAILVAAKEGFQNWRKVAGI